MTPKAPLAAAELTWTCPVDVFAVAADEQPDDRRLGQARALDALDFALALREPGYHVYAMGPEGLAKRDVILAELTKAAAAAPAPDDVCYVMQFRDPRKPRLLRLPAGRGSALRGDLAGLVRDLKAALAAALDNEEYRSRREMLEQDLKDRQEEAIGEIETAAREASIALVHTPMGFAFMPTRDGKVVPPDEFNSWPEADRQRVRDTIADLEKQLQATVRQFPRWVSEARETVRGLSRDTAAFALQHLFEPLAERYGDLPEVATHLEEMRTDVLEHVDAILETPDEAFDFEGRENEHGHPLLRRYLVNLMVDASGAGGAPVIVEDDPTYDRLFGRIEHLAQMGTLLTDLHLIRPGALHRANGGYLVLEVERLLTRPFAWDALARALERLEIAIEPPMQALGFASTTTLAPESVPLDVKVVLLGSRRLYFLLQAFETKFQHLFKIAADFEEDVRHDEAALAAFARERRTEAAADGLLPPAPHALARLAEYAARRSGDQAKLSTEREVLRDVLREADSVARRNGASSLDGRAVERAIEGRRQRLARLRERSLEAMVDGTLAITTQGAVVGQVNGLSVVPLGDAGFGKPSRITARVRLGAGKVVDIEREVELGGPLHSKGVLILAGYLSANYVPETPLSLHASLVFEQSYGGVEGDSASSAELYTLLSALAVLPLAQGIAVTGSVNQNGEVQAIGGVNEKIEGFFDLCAARGLTGEQGVLIPVANRRHLMLHRRVREAVAEGCFNVWTVGHIDEGLQLLTGCDAGSRGQDGTFPETSVHGRVEARLRAFAEARRAYGHPSAGGGRPGDAG
ncbi:MAG: Lon protease family protein [Pseudomonadota bacterium]